MWLMNIVFNDHEVGNPNAQNWEGKYEDSNLIFVLQNVIDYPTNLEHKNIDKSTQTIH